MLHATMTFRRRPSSRQPVTRGCDGSRRAPRTALHHADLQHPVDLAARHPFECTGNDQIEEWRKKAAKCAEVLVPNRVEPRFLRGVYVSSDQARADVSALNTGLTVIVDRHLFFS
ncbi:MAG: DUF4433 domain-containing protein [Phycisphaerae bacterium]|nr:DUF4433 domain-containing protein [Phycisphaerae bacterium]